MCENKQPNKQPNKDAERQRMSSWCENRIVPSRQGVTSRDSPTDIKHILYAQTHRTSIENYVEQI